MHGGRGMHGAMDPESMAKHVDKMIERIAPDATPQQKARLAEISKAAFADLKPLHARFRDGHKRLHELLMALSHRPRRAREGARRPDADRRRPQQARTDRRGRRGRSPHARAAPALPEASAKPRTPLICKEGVKPCILEPFKR
ncbi:hypothetical protein LP420_20595 [Massilia sp. B-10]|nr:hypothetical protein LP420_20595 [Massilia sp. B-10]